MPDLHPTLHDEIVALLLSRRAFRLPDARLAELDPHLSDWPGRHDLKWDAPANEFCHSFVKNAPGAALKRALQETARQSGELDRADITRLCQQIDATLARMSGATNLPRPLIAYYEALKAELSTGRYQLDRRFVQLTLLIDQGQDAQGLRFVADSQRGKYDSLQKLLAEVDDRALVLLGGPGSGKTTLLRRLQLEFAWDGVVGSADRVPFFVPLNAYRGARLADPPPDPADWLAERWQAEYRRAGQSGLPDFAALLREGRLLLLLDGLNEMPHRDREDYGERVAQWQLFVQDAPAGNSLLFSCRSLDYSVPLGSELTTVRQVQVEPLTPAQIEQFLVHYLDDEADEVWAALREDNQQLALFATPFFLRLLVDQKLATGELLTSRVALLTGFVRRALYREVGERRHYLFAPGELLTANDGQQALHNRWATPLALPQQGLLIPKLEALAYGMQNGRSAHEAAQVRIPEETAHVLLDHPRAEEIVAAGIQLNVLDKELTRLEITYLHQLLQEYFAARILARQPEPARVQTAWRAEEMPERLQDWLKTANVSDLLPAAPTTGWEETTLLAAAMTANQEQFVTDLMAANLPLAARCAAAPDVTVSAKLVARLQEDLLARIADPEADLRARIAAAEALGDLGDPRFERRTGPHGEYLLPPVAAVAAGMHTIGADDSQYDAEKPAHPVQIDAFAMGVFPVTNAEYRLFMAAGGYEDEQWWETEAARDWLRGAGDMEVQKSSWRDIHKQLQGMTEDAIRNMSSMTPEQVEGLIAIRQMTSDAFEQFLEEQFPTGKIYRQPGFWTDSRFNHPSRPVVGVTWFEARAYCAWLSAQTGDSYRLPTESEWEAAARGQTRREYAYGSGYDAGRCNTFESHIRRTTPVGVFPGGQTPEGIADLSGNVWEWTSSQYRPYRYDPTDGREDPEDAEARRVLRGGSFYGSADLARAAYRSNLVPGSRNDEGGFRVVVVRRSPSHHPDH